MVSNVRVALCVALLLLTVLPGTYGGDCKAAKITKVAKLQPDDLPDDAQIGQYFRIYKDVLAGGAYAADTWQGRVYVYNISNPTAPTISQVLENSERVEYSYFGLNLDVKGDWMVVGSPFWPSNGKNSGAAWVFKYDGSQWTQTQRIYPDDVHNGAYFGYSQQVHRDGNQIIIGARAVNNIKDNIANAGGVYVYKLDGGQFTQIQKIEGPERRVQFSDEIRVEEDILLASSPRGDGMKGAAYLYKRQDDMTFTSLQTLHIQPPDGVSINEGHFSEGISLAYTLEYVVAGGERLTSRPGDLETGAAYIFVRKDDGTYSQIQFLEPDVNTPSFYGQRTRYWLDVVAVGAWSQYTGSTSGAGAAYVYAPCNGKWTQSTKLISDHPTANGEYGKMVDLNNDVLAVGAPKEDGLKGYIDLFTWELVDATPAPSDGASSTGGVEIPPSLVLNV